MVRFHHLQWNCEASSEGLEWEYMKHGLIITLRDEPLAA